ncbi:formyl transferase [Azospirillum brasilense]|nr:formyl transferase [Azospirillum brasilense]
MKPRVAFIGCVAFSRAALSHLFSLDAVAVVGVVTRRASALNADFAPLEDLAVANGCPVHVYEPSARGEMASFLRAVAPDVVFCFGWSSLLGPDILTVAPHGVVGFHPAALPANRGRHPLIWAVALGLTETASTFFLMDERADSGPIVSQEPVPILEDDDAGALYARITQTALGQITGIAAALVSGHVPTRPQDDAVANVWRRRGRLDGQIDWRMSPPAIHALVRALTRPYVGAHLVYRGRDVKVWRTRIGPAAPANLEPGRVLAVESDSVLVKCWGGSIRLVEHNLPVSLKLGDDLGE